MAFSSTQKTSFAVAAILLGVFSALMALVQVRTALIAFGAGISLLIVIGVGIRLRQDAVGQDRRLLLRIVAVVLGLLTLVAILVGGGLFLLSFLFAGRAAPEGLDTPESETGENAPAIPLVLTVDVQAVDWVEPHFALLIEGEPLEDLSRGYPCMNDVSIAMERVGLVLQEVSIRLLDRDSCIGKSSSIYNALDVTLEDFPRGVFLEGDNAQSLTIERYRNTETVRWTQDSAVIRFTTVPSSLRLFRPLLALLYGVGDVSVVGSIILGGGISALLGAVAQPVSRAFFSSKLAESLGIAVPDGIHVHVEGDAGSISIAGRDLTIDESETVMGDKISVGSISDSSGVAVGSGAVAQVGSAYRLDWLGIGEDAPPELQQALRVLQEQVVQANPDAAALRQALDSLQTAHPRNIDAVFAWLADQGSPLARQIVGAWQQEQNK
ncbi:MAG: hypothetical protein GYB68_12890 [Chloroflexi bacterium]|nr:hypothetical protein [Chloroflexota bacterium]